MLSAAVRVSLTIFWTPSTGLMNASTSISRVSARSVGNAPRTSDSSTSRWAATLLSDSPDNPSLS